MKTQFVIVGNKLVNSVSNAVAINEALQKVNLSELHPDVIKLISQQFEGIKGLVELATSQVKSINYLNETNKKLGDTCINLSNTLNKINERDEGIHNLIS